MEAWTSTAQLKAAPDTVSGWGLKRAQEKGSGREKALDCFVIDPFLTVKSNKATLINMIPNLIL